MSLFKIAIVELLILWVVWLFPFLRHRLRNTGRKSVVMARSGNWGLLLESVGIFFAWFRLPGTPEPPMMSIVLSMIFAPIATVFGWAAVRHLGKQLRILAGLYQDHELIRTGPYRIVRHPVYASLFLMMLATGLLFARWPFLVLAVVLYIAGTEIRIHAEEGLLRERFGRDFDEYRRSVPAYIPFLR
ncbi:MAG: isoprenylcysteine carboxylmethyltransferase family protein [Bryobacteraceae bacterium]